jgi:hypothetical protein
MHPAAFSAGVLAEQEVIQVAFVVVYLSGEVGRKVVGAGATQRVAEGQAGAGIRARPA